MSGSPYQSVRCYLLHFRTRVMLTAPPIRAYKTFSLESPDCERAMSIRAGIRSVRRSASGLDFDVRIGRITRRVSIAIQVAIAVLALSTSARAQQIFSLKWAMEDERYARQYSAPYSGDPLTRKFQLAQESIDARFQEGAYGVYVGGGGASYHSVGGQGEIGAFGMPTAWSTLRAGIVAMEINGQGLGGLSVGSRFHAPTRFTPYVGLAGVLEFGGFGHGERINYNQSGNKVPLIRTVYPKGLAALVPEVGVSYWMTSRARLNVGASWYVIDGKQPEFMVVSASVDFSLRDPQIPVIPPPLPPYEDEESDPYFISGNYGVYDTSSADVYRARPEVRHLNAGVEYVNASFFAASGENTQDSAASPMQVDLSLGNSESIADIDFLAPRLKIPSILASESPAGFDQSVTVQETGASVYENSKPAGSIATLDTSESEPEGQWLRERPSSPNQ